jgi:hypothetical protein
MIGMPDCARDLLDELDAHPSGHDDVDDQDIVLMRARQDQRFRGIVRHIHA